MIAILEDMEKELYYKFSGHAFVCEKRSNNNGAGYLNKAGFCKIDLNKKAELSTKLEKFWFKDKGCVAKSVFYTGFNFFIIRLASNFTCF